MEINMLNQADERAVTLVYKGNIGDKCLLMKSGLITVTAKKTGERHLKIRVALYNNKTWSSREILVYDVITNIIDMSNKVANR